VLAHKEERLAGGAIWFPTGEPGGARKRGPQRSPSFRLSPKPSVRLATMCQGFVFLGRRLSRRSRALASSLFCYSVCRSDCRGERGAHGFQVILSLAGRPRKPQAILALACLAVDRDHLSAGSRGREDGKLQSRAEHWTFQPHLRAGRADPGRHRLYQTLSRPRQIRLVGAHRPYPDHRIDLAADRARLSQGHARAEPVRSTGDGLIAASSARCRRCASAHEEKASGHCLGAFPFVRAASLIKARSP
jgi:hypothetical protein